MKKIVGETALDSHKSIMNISEFLRVTFVVQRLKIENNATNPVDVFIKRSRFILATKVKKSHWD